MSLNKINLLPSNSRKTAKVITKGRIFFEDTTCQSKIKITAKQTYSNNLKQALSLRMQIKHIYHKAHTS